MNELNVWRRRVPAAGWTRRSVITMLALTSVVLLLAIPWRGSITAPALMRAAHETPLFTTAAGQLSRIIANGATVTAGQPLFVLNSPDVEHSRASAQAELTGIRARLVGLTFDPDAADDLQVAFGELSSAVASLRSADAQADLLSVRAPFSGKLVDVPHDLQLGVWLPRREPLGVLIDPRKRVVEAYVDEADVGRLHPGDQAVFHPENDETEAKLLVRSISPEAIGALETPALASINGGGVATRRDEHGRLLPEAAVYRVILDVIDESGQGALEQQRGWVTIAGDRSSFLSRICRQAVSIILREAGP